jgi:hypothetical protein
MKLSQNLFFLLAVSAFFFLFFSCASEPSGVCEVIDDNRMCMDYQTSKVTNQYWKQQGNNYRLYISNENNFFDYKEIIAVFVINDGVMDSVPHTGKYTGVSSLGAGGSSPRFELAIRIDGELNYSLASAPASTLEITEVAGQTLKGTIRCNLYDPLIPSHTKHLYLRFGNLFHQ